MKKSIVSAVVLCLFALLGAEAQEVRNGSKWWDGSVLYTATVNAYGTVVMNGIGQHEGGFRFKLSKTLDRPGEYVLAADAPDAILPVRGELGWRVSYVRQEGMNFLAVRRPNGDVCHTLVLTPDNLTNCLAQEKFAEEEQAISDVITGMLLNTTYLSQFPKAQLRLMRNEILARHGYRFQSEDLRDHFETQPWYHPVADNNSIRLNIIEQTNVQLIKSEESVPDEERGYMPKAEDFPGGLADDGRGPDDTEDTQGTVVQYDGDQYIRVTTAEQFLHSIISGINILVARDTEINLSSVLDDKDWWNRQNYYFKWRRERATDVGKAQAIISEEVFDGRQLTICNYKQIVIRGEGNSHIVVQPRHAFCLNFVNCEQIEIRNLIIGHTVGGSCEGGVIGVDGGWRISIHDCDLYGCGTYGVQLQNTRDFSMYASNIHDCTYGIMTLQNVEFAKFERCDFFRNREFALVESRGSNVTFFDCRFYANNANSPLFLFDRDFFLAGCEIYHPTEYLGDIDLADQSGKKNWFSENPLDTNIKPRGIGPDQKK
ncbi:MAG: YARHG domain-containing protein [Prevotella sp.]|nr:YARHG domain-containing protein [Prevotella sp.]